MKKIIITIALVLFALTVAGSMHTAEARKAKKQPPKLKQDIQQTVFLTKDIHLIA